MEISTVGFERPLASRSLMFSSSEVKGYDKVLSQGNVRVQKYMEFLEWLCYADFSSAFEIVCCEVDKYSHPQQQTRLVVRQIKTNIVNACYGVAPERIARERYVIFHEWMFLCNSFV